MPDQTPAAPVIPDLAPTLAALNSTLQSMDTRLKAIETEVHKPETEIADEKLKGYGANGKVGPSRSRLLEKEDEEFRHRDPLKARGLKLARLALVKAGAKLDGADETVYAAKRYGDDFADLVKASTAHAKEKAMSAGTLSSGGAWALPAIAADFIDVLDPVELMAELSGINRIPLDAQSYIITEATGRTTAYYVGENVAPTLSTPTTGLNTVTQKNLCGASIVSRSLLRSASINVDAYVRNRLRLDFGLKMSLTWLRGSSGVASTPTGIRYLCNSNNRITESGLTLALVDYDLERLIGKVADNNVPLNGCVWIMSHRTMRGLKQLKDSGVYPYKEDLEKPTPMLKGYRAIISNQVPNNLGGGTDSEIYFGQPAEVTLVEAPAIELTVFTEAMDNGSGTTLSLGSLDQVGFQIRGSHNWHLDHDTSWSVLTDSTVNAAAPA